MVIYRNNRLAVQIYTVLCNETMDFALGVKICEIKFEEKSTRIF